jgi:hypothetical protein
MHTWDVIGYVASTLVLTAFGMKSIIPLRVIAMCSNLVFIIYGLGLGLTPVWSLHVALLPMNAWRLVEALGGVQAVGAHLLRQAADDDGLGQHDFLVEEPGGAEGSFRSFRNASSLPRRSQARAIAAPPLLR